NGAATGPIGLNASGPLVAAVQSQLIKLDYSIPASELEAQVFGTGTRDSGRAFQSTSGLEPTGLVADATRLALPNAVAAQSGGHQVEGRILLDNGLPADGMTVRLYDRGFGGHSTRLSEAVTDARGYYLLPYKSNAHAPNLEVRAVDAQGKETSLSETRFNA